MNATKFTPGPWVLENGADIFGPLGGDSGDGLNCDDNDAWQVAEVGYYQTFVDGELVDLGENVRKSNAHLIAAAPELYEALEEAEKDLVAAQVNARRAAAHDPAWSGVSEAIQPSIDRARAARAKARGDS